MLIAILVAALLLLAIIYSVLTGDTNSTDARLEADAKRFARLIISEIKLYENYKIERGLRNSNLLESFHDEINAARKKFKRRITGSKFEHFFDDALVEILADNDKGKLGLIS